MATQKMTVDQLHDYVRAQEKDVSNLFLHRTFTNLQSIVVEYEELVLSSVQSRKTRRAKVSSLKCVLPNHDLRDTPHFQRK